LVATIDGHEYTISEATIRTVLHLDDLDAADVLPNQVIFDGLQAIGYRPDGPWSYLFKKGKFAPQWKFLIHYLNHCISPKGGSFTQFGSQLAFALVCLSTDRVYNFSRYIFTSMVSNVSGRHKFLMYPRFVQLALNITPTDTTEYVVLSFTSKVFANLRQYKGPVIPLLAAMLPQVAQTNPLEGSPIAPQANEPMPDPAHAPYVEEPIPSPNIASTFDPLLSQAQFDAFTDFEAQQHHDQATGGSLIYKHPPIPNPATPGVSTTEGAAEVPFTTDQMLALFPMCLQ
nr:hypothetical protein [Tanacetum cinerariifolium]